jgi:hypothetical protein
MQVFRVCKRSSGAIAQEIAHNALKIGLGLERNRRGAGELRHAQKALLDQVQGVLARHGFAAQKPQEQGGLRAEQHVERGAQGGTGRQEPRTVKRLWLRDRIRGRPETL